MLGSPASSSRDRGANPPGDHRECGRPPTCSELACCGRRPPRVVIVVPTRGSALSSSHYRGSTSSSCHYRDTNRGFSRLNWSAQPTLLSLSWYKPWFDVLLESLSWFKPGERLSVANGWMCQYPWCKNTGVRTMVQTGGESNVSQPLLESLSWCQPLLESLSMAQTRVETLGGNPVV